MEYPSQNVSYNTFTIEMPSESTAESVEEQPPVPEWVNPTIEQLLNGRYCISRGGGKSICGKRLVHGWFCETHQPDENDVDDLIDCQGNYLGLILSLGLPDGVFLPQHDKIIILIAMFSFMWDNMELVTQKENFRQVAITKIKTFVNCNECELDCVDQGTYGNLDTPYKYPSVVKDFISYMVEEYDIDTNPLVETSFSFVIVGTKSDVTPSSTNDAAQ